MDLRIIVCVVAIAAYVSAGQPSTLKLVQILYRHGDRTPVNSFPNDIHRGHWTEDGPGFGQLTKVGMEQQYVLGKYLRSIYDDFLPINYNLSDIHVRSTNIDRTIMSAQCNLAGLYPPQKDHMWNRNIPWQPIPVHTLPEDDDYILFNAPCPYYDELMKKVMESPEMVALNEKYADLLELLTEKTGSNVTTVMDGFRIYDTLFVEKTHNLTVPNWAVKEWTNLSILNDLSFEWNLRTHELRRLRGGPLLGAMIENMKAKMNGSSNTRFYMYSAHDTTVSALLAAMNVFNNVSPPYTAAVIVELHQIDTSYIVKLSYRNQSSSPFPLVIPGCTAACPFTSFNRLLANMIPTNVRRECKVVPAGQSGFSEYPILAVVASTLGFLVAMMVGSMVYKACRRRYRGPKEYVYTSIQQADSFIK